VPVYSGWKITKRGDVIIALKRLKKERGIVPKHVQTDIGGGFTFKKMHQWAYENKVTMDYSKPGKPTDNPFVESFNDSFRDECLKCTLVLIFGRRARENRGLEKGLQ
jgi:putative transposase